MKDYEETRLLLNDSKFFYFIASDMTGNYAYVNRHYAEEFNYVHANFIDQPYHITMHPDDRQICMDVSKRCFENPGQLFPAIIRKHDGRGGYIYTQWEYRAMFDLVGNPAGIFCLGYNITELLSDKKLLKGAITEIEEKSELINKIAFQQSHLIRAPLTNIISLCVLLRKELQSEKSKLMLDMIFESINQLDTEIKNVVQHINEEFDSRSLDS